jgi:hypothetical protein
VKDFKAFYIDIGTAYFLGSKVQSDIEKALTVICSKEH